MGVLRYSPAMHLQPPRCRRAFTLLEVLLALVLLGTGILGLSASAGLVSRLVGDGSRLTLAAALATARLEQLRALPCASTTAGGATARGIEQRWTVTPMGASPPRALEIQITVTYRLRSHQGAGTTRTQAFRGAVPCADA